MDLRLLGNGACVQVRLRIACHRELVLVQTLRLRVLVAERSRKLLLKDRERRQTILVHEEGRKWLLVRCLLLGDVAEWERVCERRGLLQEQQGQHGGPARKPRAQSRASVRHVAVCVCVTMASGCELLLLVVFFSCV